MGSGESIPKDELSPNALANMGVIPEGDQIIIAVKSVSDSKLSMKNFQIIIDGINIALVQFCYAWGFPKVQVIVGFGWEPGIFGMVTLVDNIPFNSKTSSLGYHTLDHYNRPIAVVDYNAHEQDNRQILGFMGDFTGINPSAARTHSYLSSTLSHEVFEMIVDPDLNNSLISPGKPILFRSQVNGKYYPIAREVCDPVCSIDIIIQKDDDTNISISNYVLPSWFFKDGIAPYDAGCHVKTPLSVLKNGFDYVSSSECKVVYHQKKGWIALGPQGVIS